MGYICWLGHLEDLVLNVIIDNMIRSFRTEAIATTLSVLFSVAVCLKENYWVKLEGEDVHG